MHNVIQQIGEIFIILIIFTLINNKINIQQRSTLLTLLFISLVCSSWITRFFSNSTKTVNYFLKDLYETESTDNPAQSGGAAGHSGMP